MDNLPKGNLSASSVCGRVGFAAVLALLAVTPCAADATYGYIRTVEGDADLITGDSQAAVEASANYPVQVGDRVRVSPGGHLEVLIPDGSHLRFAENSELRFARLAESFQSAEDRNHLQLLQGRLQVDLLKDPIDSRSFRVDTANASLFFLSGGSYHLFTDGRIWSQVVVRRGFAEIVTDSGEYFVGAGQQALIDGDDRPRVTTQAAPPLDELERWAQRLDSEAETLVAQMPYRRGYVPETLAYSATPLHRHGRWTSYRGSTVWRPHVPIGWRPYHSGWWIYTPAGLTWVSTEPWGWVTYHYGSWGYAGNNGWVWHPGRRYTPGAVYWYWGPSHVGWIPTGYYPPYFNSGRYAMPPYGHFGGVRGPSYYSQETGYSTHFNMRARAGENVADWRDWTFSPYEKLGYRDSYRFLKTGEELQSQGVSISKIPKGVMTTDTRGLTPNLWSEPQRLLAALDRPRSSISRRTDLSSLSTGALPGSSAPPGQVDHHRGETWRQLRLRPPQTTAPYRRDTRSATSYLQGGHDSPLTRRNPATARGSRFQNYYRRGISIPSRSPLSGIAGRSSSGPRSTIPAPRTHGIRGQSRSPAHSTGRVSGSSGTGRSSGRAPRPGVSSSSGGGSG